ncbi:MAG: putative zinc-binding peptidase [Caldilineaceae bacterium]|nr:putative zinc-binding peptidase [Caldilineaceae bacterium]
MKLFRCRNCGQLLYFENIVCEKCGHALGYSWEQDSLLTLAASQNDLWFEAQAPTTPFIYCKNYEYGVCNWLIPQHTGDTLCIACQLNRTIPDLSKEENLKRWRKLELAKHRLVYSLQHLNLPVITKNMDEEWGLAFDFLADAEGGGQEEAVTTGHDNGIITINIAEADDAQREQMRESLSEPYRTLLGHFRHEIAHYYWMRFAQSPKWLADFRQIFGDDSADYGESLRNHYANADNIQWKDEFISAYASAHPWEDWAETWAHYLHIVDTLETAYAFGIQVEPTIHVDETFSARADVDAYREPKFERIIDTWLPLTFAINSLNRSMGNTDLYPFVLTPVVLKKMEFIHNSIRFATGNS